MIHIIKIIFSPSFWLMSNPYNKDWDEKLNELLLEYSFVNITEYRATLWTYDIWIANYPYAAFTYGDMRPSRKTIIKAKGILNKSLFSK